VIKEASEHETWKASSFWSVQQRSPNPALIFHPSSAREVAIAVLLCKAAGCKFAVKSGGHAAMNNASSVEGGVVFDMKNFNKVELNDDKTVATLGTGNRWEQVFKELEKDGLGVAGGRAGDVGVGGYTLGGGISFFASAQGWGCDTVRNYELVTANGDILNVNLESYPELFWALRGGGNNFGIVTRFAYETFPQRDVFAGSNVYDHKHKDAVIAAFNTFSNHGDPKAATWLSIVYSNKRKLISALAMYADPDPSAEVLKPYLAIPSLHSTSKVRSMADMVSLSMYELNVRHSLTSYLHLQVHEIAVVNVKEHRQNYTNHTFKFDAEFVSWLAEIYWKEIEGVDETYESDQACVLVLQIYTKEAVALMQRNGGNCLSLREDEAPYLNVLIPSAWKHEKDDEIVASLVERIFDQAIDEGKRRDLYRDFKYMNYASASQDVLKGYGEENYERLKDIAAKYDPDQVFQKLMPGYFKFGGATK
jgi:FAD/FMN-containing dehydrogenase